MNGGGTPYSYCGLNDICCVPATDQDDATAIIHKLTHLSNTPAAKVFSCGKKGFDTNRDGIADPGEWAWHVSIIILLIDYLEKKH